MSYTIYCHTHLATGKKYIGMTSQNVERRWQKGAGYYRTCFGEAVKQYGWDAFSHEIILTGLTESEAVQAEKDYIAKFKSNDPKYGFNLSAGGRECDCIVRKYGEDHPNHQRVKMIDPKTGEVLRVFGAQSEAARIMGISRKGITKACQGIGTASYKGYIWEYADKDYVKPGNPGAGNYPHTKLMKALKMIDVDGSEYYFESIKEAGEKLGINKTNISRYLKGQRKDGSGRRWCYA